MTQDRHTPRLRPPRQGVQEKSLLDELIADFGFRRFPGATASLRAFVRQRNMEQSRDLPELMAVIAEWSMERKAGRVH